MGANWLLAMSMGANACKIHAGAYALVCIVLRVLFQPPDRLFGSNVLKSIPHGLACLLDKRKTGSRAYHSRLSNHSVK